MKKVFYLATLLVLLMPSAASAEYGNPSGIELYPWNVNLKKELLCGHTYTSADFSDIKAGSMMLSEDGETLLFDHLEMECEEGGNDGSLLYIPYNRSLTISLTGENRLTTKGGFSIGIWDQSHLKLTGEGSLETNATWYDIFISKDGELVVENTKLLCKGDLAVGGYQENIGESIVVRNSRFEGREIWGLSKMTLAGCFFKFPYQGWFDAEENGYQIKDAAGNAVDHFLITTLDDNNCDVVVNGDFEGSDFSSFLYKNSYVVQEVTAKDIVVEDGNHCLKIVSQANAKDAWDSEFFIKIPEPWALGGSTIVHFSMRVKANRPTTISSTYYTPQSHYFTTEMFGDINVSTEWKTISGYYKKYGWVQIKDFGEEKAFIFSLNNDKENPTEFYFDDISVEFVDVNEVNSGDITFENQVLFKNRPYTHEDFDDIKEGSFSVSEDGSELTFYHLIVESDKDMFASVAPMKLILKGENSIRTSKNMVLDMTFAGNLTITGDGSLTTQSNWFDISLFGCDCTLDHTTLICNGGRSFGNNMSAMDKVIVNNSTFKGNAFFRIRSLTLINSAFTSPKDVVFDPKDGGTQLYTTDGEQIWGFEIQPVEGDFSNRVSPWKYDDIIIPLGGTKDVTFSMKNDGIEDIREIECVVSIDGVEKLKKTIALDEPYTKTGDDFVVTLPVVAMDKVSKSEMTLTVTKVNGKKNTSEHKAIKGFLHTVSEAPTRRVVVEEFTGTWCGWCPRGMVALDMLNQEFGDRVITIAVHNSDPMVAESYTLGSNSLPSARVNRGDLMDPYYGNSSEGFGTRDIVDRELNIMAPAAISVSATWADEAQSAIRVKTETTFLIDTDVSQYGIGYALLEDGMKGTGSKWAQKNFYAGSNTGDPNLEPLEALPAVITDIEYNHVAVDAWEINNGADDCFKTAQINVPQENTYLCDIADNEMIQDKSQLSVVVLLIDKTTGIIVNAAKTGISDYAPSAISNILTEKSLPADIYNINGYKVGSTADNHVKNLPKGIYVIDGRKVVVK